HDAVQDLGRERASRIYRLTLAELDRIAAETPHAVRLVGSLRIASSPDEAEDCHRQLTAMHGDDLPVAPYEGPEGSGLLIPSDGAFNPLERCRTLAIRLLDDGALLFEHTAALNISGDRIGTPTGTIRCSRVVVAVDGNLERVIPELAGRVRTARLQMLATSATDEVLVPRPVYARYGLEYWQQLPDGRVALGGFRDHGGEAEWTGGGLPSPRVQDRLTGFLREHIGVSAPVTHRWAAPVGFSTTSTPVLAEVRQGVFAVGGYSGTGNVLGAVCGRLAARLAVRGSGEPDADLFDA
ncbi:MAG TPA: FAD-dependent oxidoreductase, partial [Longimicrobiaceae bacterium]|nr:FAD-dependent oxidoreductase [Longimicrobiaceae bacterium]